MQGMNNVSKAEALRIIHNCATAYKANLAHKKLLFITVKNHLPAHFEAVFLPRNFLHLTGVRSDLDSMEFYNLAVNDRLRENEFEFNLDGTTIKKLNVLPVLMNIHFSARMAGDYDYSQSLLVTDKLAGTVTAAMGFKKKDSLYVPNTSLKVDLRDISIRPIQRIAAVFIKDRREEKYTRLTYIAKGLKIDDAIFKPSLRDKVDSVNLTAAFEIPKKSIAENLAEAIKEAAEQNPPKVKQNRRDEPEL
jgi:hypothetical protein